MLSADCLNTGCLRGRRHDNTKQSSTISSPCAAPVTGGKFHQKIRRHEQQGKAASHARSVDQGLFQTADQGIAMSDNTARNEAILALWAEGLSAAKIAQRLGGGISRNCVIGVCARARATIRPTIERFSTHNKTSFRVGAVYRTAHSKPLPKPVEDGAPIPLGLSIEALSDRTCRWPVSGEGISILFCGHHPADGHVYCIEHCHRAYQKPIERAA